MSELIVLDSHIWFWWINLEHRQLPSKLLAEIDNAPRVGVSPVSCFELALAHRRGRLEFPYHFENSLRWLCPVLASNCSFDARDLSACCRVT